MTHCSLTQTGLLSRSWMAETGQFRAHRPQPMQLSSTWKGKMEGLHSDKFAFVERSGTM